jgi:hypothetical protein
LYISERRLLSLASFGFMSLAERERLNFLVARLKDYIQPDSAATRLAIMTPHGGPSIYQKLVSSVWPSQGPHRASPEVLLGSTDRELPE